MADTAQGLPKISTRNEVNENTIWKQRVLMEKRHQVVRNEFSADPRTCEFQTFLKRLTIISVRLCYDKPTNMKLHLSTQQLQVKQRICNLLYLLQAAEAKRLSSEAVKKHYDPAVQGRNCFSRPSILITTYI